MGYLLWKIWSLILSIASICASFLPVAALAHFCRAIRTPTIFSEGNTEKISLLERSWEIALGVFTFAAQLLVSYALSVYAWGLVTDYTLGALKLLESLPEEDRVRTLLSIVPNAIPLFYALDFLSISRVKEIPEEFRLVKKCVETRFNILGNLLLFGLSLLPLSVIILLLPALFPNEAVLSDSVRSARRSWVALFRRILGVLAGITALVALFAVSMEFVGALQLKKSYVSGLPEVLLPPSLIEALPKVAIEQWHFVLISVYLLDIGILFMIGKVPLQYNLRNLRARWITTAMTALAFTLVVMLLSVMFAFINGLKLVASSSGVPGNVIVLSEGSTDEAFSNLGYGEVAIIENERATEDRAGNPLAEPVIVKQIAVPGTGKKVRLCSKETYFSVNHEVRAPKPGIPGKRRLVQLRGIQDAFIAGKVHNLELREGEWFEDKPILGEDGKTTYTQCVMGEGVAEEFGNDNGKPCMKIGDKFNLGGLNMILVGIMKTQGTTFGSEIWARWERVSQQFNKKVFTTVALRVNDDSDASADIMAYHLSNNFKSPRVRAVTETQYFEDQAKQSQSYFYLILGIGGIMAIGGIFGVMNTMFAAIAQRVKDIGILRIIGFKRWQLLISFMLETLTIAIIGGAVGCALGSLADGYQMKSLLSSGNGPGGKSVILRLTVDWTIIICGMLFTIVMGRLGGLVPSLSAMRLKILDSLR